MSVEVAPLTREPTVEGQGAQKTVGQAVAFPPRRGWGTHTVHSSIRKCQERGERAALPAQRGACVRASLGQPWKTTGFNYVQHSAVHKVNSKRGTTERTKNRES